MVITPSTLAHKNNGWKLFHLVDYWKLNPVFSLATYVFTFYFSFSFSFSFIFIFIFLFLFYLFLYRMVEYFKNDKDLLHFFHWRRIVADEAHEYIKLGKYSLFKYNFFWFVSATPFGDLYVQFISLAHCLFLISFLFKFQEKFKSVIRLC